MNAAESDLEKLCDCCYNLCNTCAICDHSISWNKYWILFGLLITTNIWHNRWYSKFSNIFYEIFLTVCVAVYYLNCDSWGFGMWVLVASILSFLWTAAGDLFDESLSQLAVDPKVEEGLDHAVHLEVIFPLKAVVVVKKCNNAYWELDFGNGLGNLTNWECAEDRLGGHGKEAACKEDEAERSDADLGLNQVTFHAALQWRQS